MFGALTLFGAPWQTAADLAAGVVVIEVCNLHHDWWIAGNSRSAVAYRAWLQRRESRRTAAR
jgi:hypothetical protein